jgi:hypothetical protein
MMKILMTLGCLSRGKKPKGDPGVKDVAPIPAETTVMTIFD